MKKRGHRIVPVLPYGAVQGFTKGILKSCGRFYPAGTWRTAGSGVLTENGGLDLDREVFLD